MPRPASPATTPWPGKAFRARASAASGRLGRYDNSQRGPTGEALSTDTAWFGPDDAARVLVLVSATHGIEGFCGSGAQIDWITQGGPPSLPSGMAALLVHAVNPYGFAWLRRTTEEGVDLNRNCVCFEDGLPDNPGYEELATAFVPTSLDAASIAAADRRLRDYEQLHGKRAYDVARSSGQYTHPDGIFFGGRGPTWALGTINAICRDFGLGERSGVVEIDYHTGLGPFGHGEPIVGHKPGTPGQARCRAWYGGSPRRAAAWDVLIRADRRTDAIRPGSGPSVRSGSPSSRWNSAHSSRRSEPLRSGPTTGCTPVAR